MFRLFRPFLNTNIKFYFRVSICLKRLGDFAEQYSCCVTIGRTHYQAASLVTIGKRACIWAQELLMALETVCLFFI